MTASIFATIPVLASLDFDHTLAFYTEKLGFEPRLRAGDYLILSRNGAELHFWACAERVIAENTSCYIRSADVQALYEEFAPKLPQLKAPLLQPWGMKELYVIDPHGNLLKFGEMADGS